MKKVIKRIGGSMGVYFNKEEQNIYNLKIGDVIDLEFSKEVIDAEEKTDNNDNEKEDEWR